MTRNRQLQVALVLLLFSILGIVQHLSVIGEDLSSSYVGCKVLAAGKPGHLYSHDLTLYNAVGDPLWTDIASDADFEPTVMLHPYVQTPLWAYTLRPLCTSTSFPTFNKLFVVLAMLCFSGTIWLISRHWTPLLFHPGWIALICACLYVSEPFRYALSLTQTHIIFIFLSVLALIWARNGHPVWAGILLSLAAAVKITPGLLLLYWLLTRQKKAALSFAVSSVVLLMLTLLSVGPALTMAYLRELSDLSDVLLVSFNNQSLASLWVAHEYPPAELFIWHTYKLPPIVKVASLLLCLASTVIGAILDRRSAAVQLFLNQASTATQPVQPPFGAVFAIVGATIFTPIAWTHYYIVLLVPVMLMMDTTIRRRSALFLVLVLAVFALNIYPVSFEAVGQLFKPFSIVRSQFYAGLLSLAGLFLIYRMLCRDALRYTTRRRRRSYRTFRHRKSMHAANLHVANSGT